MLNSSMPLAQQVGVNIMSSFLRSAFRKRFSFTIIDIIKMRYQPCLNLEKNRSLKCLVVDPLQPSLPTLEQSHKHFSNFVLVINLHDDNLKKTFWLRIWKKCSLAWLFKSCYNRLWKLALFASIILWFYTCRADLYQPGLTFRKQPPWQSKFKIFFYHLLVL